MKVQVFILLLAASLPACKNVVTQPPSYRGMDKSVWENQVIKQSREINGHPQWAEPYQLRGYAYFQLGDFSLALKDFKSALEQDPNYLLALFNRGVTYSKIGKQDSAKIDFKTLLARDSSHARSYFQLGSISFQNNDFDSAQHYFGKAIRLDPEYSHARHFRAACNYYLQKEEAAIRDYTLILYDHPSDPIALANRGLSQIAMDEWRYALVDISKAIEIDPSLAEAWYFQGLAHVQGKNYLKAITSFTQAIRQNPNNAYFFLQRGMAKQKLGKNSEARADFDQALLKNPNLKFISDQTHPGNSRRASPIKP